MQPPCATMSTRSPGWARAIRSTRCEHANAVLLPGLAVRPLAVGEALGDLGARQPRPGADVDLAQVGVGDDLQAVRLGDDRRSRARAAGRSSRSRRMASPASCPRAPRLRRGPCRSAADRPGPASGRSRFQSVSP